MPMLVVEPNNDTLSNFIRNPDDRASSEAFASTPRLWRDGQLTDKMLRVLAALEYMYYSMKPCARRINVLWNRRRHWDDARRGVHLRTTMWGLSTDSATQNLSSAFREQYDQFRLEHRNVAEAWGRNFYSECDTMLQSLPSTAFNWAAFFGSSIPREVRNSTTDPMDLVDLSHIGEQLLCRDLMLSIALSQEGNNEQNIGSKIPVHL